VGLWAEIGVLSFFSMSKSCLTVERSFLSIYSALRLRLVLAQRF
jgi:hypothetical protein